MNSLKSVKEITWAHVIKLCGIVGMLASIWVMVAVTSTLWADPSSRIFPLLWMFGLGLGPFMFVFCWRLFALRWWAGIVVCFLGWMLIRDLLTSPVAKASLGFYTYLCIVVTLILSIALLAARKEWKAGL